MPVQVVTLTDTINRERIPMAIPHADPGMPVDLRAFGETLAKTEATALAKNDAFEAIRLVLRNGHEVCHEHEVGGMITFYCIQGRVALTASGGTHDLPAGHWVYLSAPRSPYPACPRGFLGASDGDVQLTAGNA